MTFAKRYRYRFGDIDDAGIGYYPTFFHYFHCAFEDWWSDHLQIDYARLMHERDLGFPAVHVESDFFAPIRYGDEPLVHVGVLRIGGSSVDFGFWMSLEGAEPEVRCRARITTVAVGMGAATKRAIPADVRALFERELLADGEFPAGRTARG
jgi:4-hydroxybenzoyl-CoA thioesterase